MKKLILLSILLLCFAGIYAQESIITGVVKDTEKEAVPGANIVVKGSSIGTISDFDGNFRLTTSLTGQQTLAISFVGMQTVEKKLTFSGGEISLGEIILESDAVGLEEVKVLADVAIDRKTPVAVSTVQPIHIIEKLGTQEFPEILKSTPGVYATKQGGGFGDSRINLRGFGSRNVAVMINGVPVNDMESGWVYWSNWAGLADVTRSMQVQRGLGASKVAIPSIGGTINIMTKTTDIKRGGNLLFSVGENGYTKVGTTVSTGMTEDNWATTFSIAKTQGNGYVDGTEFESYSYYFNTSKRLNDQHMLSFSIFGAPQWHGQRLSRMYIKEYDDAMSGRKYNKDWGYKNGEVYYMRRNFYHKPQGVLNHFWNVNGDLNITTALYASVGTGGGTGPYGSGSTIYRDGQIDFDAMVDRNIAQGPLGSNAIIRASNNNHHWYGILSSGRYELGDITLSGGVDLRYYKGEHYREVVDLLGGDFYAELNVDKNKPIKTVKEGDKIAYYNEGEVLWEGLFLQGEYELDQLATFASLSFSNKSYRRTDYFNYTKESGDQKTDWYNFPAFMVKGGANYNLTEVHNVFVNAGYYQNQPDFRSVFYNYTNEANEDAENEKVLSFELGYGFRSKTFSANINGYYTLWKDKTFVQPEKLPNGKDIFANVLGVDAVHSGIEMDFRYKPISSLTLSGMLSLGNWLWANDLKDVSFYDENQVEYAKFNLFIKDVHVGDAAQTTAALGLDYEFLPGLKFGFDYNFYGNNYADYNVLYRSKAPEKGSNPDSWQLPDYHLFDMNMRYNFEMGKLNATITGKVSNLFDEEYITDATDGSNHRWNTAKVFYGWGRSMSVGLKIKF
ncbi:MAG: TonB-dependent receptor [Bacteroidia bacterium]|nr:MAG: TonB-dependent receptor [Bacteroidia bacterium]